MMNKRMKRVISLLAATTMLVSSLAGCGSADNVASKESTSQATSTSEAASESQTATSEVAEEKVDYDVTLKWLNLGWDGSDRQQILDEINAILDEKLGVTLEVEYCADANAHSLALATGKDLDIVVSNGWMNYPTHVNNGAYMELTDEDLMTYAPDIWAAGQELDILDATKVDGKRYAIGSTYDMEMSAFAYRGDIADKYGIGTIENFEDFEDYLYAVAENEPDMIAWDLPSSNWWIASALWFGAQGWVSIGSLSYGMPVYTSHFDPNHEVFLATDRPEYLEFVTKMQEWYEAGIFSKGILSNSTSADESFKAGRSAVTRSGSLSGMQNLYDELQADERKDWDIRFWEFYHTNAYYKSSAQTSTAVSAFSDNKEAALATLNEIYTNEELYDLFAYGIEGLNYNVDDKGRYIAVSDESFGGWTAPVKNNDYVKETVVYTFPEYERLKAHYEEITTNDLAISLNLNTEAFSTIVTNVNEVTSQYRAVNSVGAFDGTAEEAVSNEKAAYKAAGIEEYIKNLQEQLDAWYASME